MRGQSSKKCRYVLLPSWRRLICTRCELGELAVLIVLAVVIAIVGMDGMMLHDKWVLILTTSLPRHELSKPVSSNASFCNSNLARDEEQFQMVRSESQ